MANKEVRNQVDKIKELIENLKSDFEEKFDDSSESWQNGERGEQCMSNIAFCENVIDSLAEIE